MIWSKVRPQNREMAPAPARWLSLASSFRQFPIKRFIKSQHTQKQSCRARQGLSNGIKQVDIRSKSWHLIVE